MRARRQRRPLGPSRAARRPAPHLRCRQCHRWPLRTAAQCLRRGLGIGAHAAKGGNGEEKASPPRRQRRRPRRLSRPACRPGSGGHCACARAPSDEYISEARAWTHGRAGRSAAGACVQEQGAVRVRARAGAPRGASRRGLMPWKSAAISTEVSESMGIVCAFCSHLRRGSGWLASAE